MSMPWILRDFVLHVAWDNNDQEGGINALKLGMPDNQIKWMICSQRNVATCFDTNEPTSIRS
jgi:hypothetical protein